MAFKAYSVEILTRFCHDLFETFGFTRGEAEQITDVLLLADLYGIRSHGVQRLIRYHRSITRGCVKVNARPEVVFETPVSAVIDGHAGMGQLISVFAMKTAIEKARRAGMAFVTVRNSNHFGIAGYYTKMACDAGLIGISCTNSESIMVHTGAREAILGSNPLSFAMPADPYPFWFDAATTVVPKGKLEVYHKMGKPLCPSWATDETGKPCTDAKRVLSCIDGKQGGGILPVGGVSEETGSHKGYGFGMIAELLCSISSGGATSNHHIREPQKGAGTCHAFIVVDPKIFGDEQAMRDRLSVFLRELRAAKRADETIPIYTHGQKEAEGMERRRREGIDVDTSTLAEMFGICRDLGMDPYQYFGNVDLSQAKEPVY